MMLRALELCCGAGGVSMGLWNAGFDVQGVDIKPFKRYPSQKDFVLADFRTMNPRKAAKMFDFIWASPPCQKHTALKHMHNAKPHIDLIPDARRFIEASGLPGVIENVVGAPLRDPLTLTGTMFGLGAWYRGRVYQLRRERQFEFIGWPKPEAPKDHYIRTQPVIGVYGGHARCRAAEFGGRGTKDFEGASQLKLASRAMGIHWMTLGELSQAIPPAYSEWIGRQFLKGARR